ncbi:MAG TPA: vanadium-dependent haloperoxidase, partial [bacterium]|nr:vanadium-dependent haloperoxidase [bacterium]
YQDFPAALDSIRALHGEFEVKFKGETSKLVFLLSANYGRRVGHHIYKWSKQDGFSTRSQEYTPCTDPHCWQPTPPGILSAFEPEWGQLRTFALEDGAEADQGPPPVYSEEPDSEFYTLALEVYDTVNNLSPEQETIALYWADGPGVTGTPPGHSISMTRQLMEQENFALDVAAEAYAKAGIAVADAFITCWWSKYQYNLLRPVTYIQRIIDGTWLSFITTPNFPEYTSGHSAQSGAWAEVMTETFGDIAFTDHTHDDRGFEPRAFNTFFEAAEEAAVSRLYGGIHYRTGNETGLEQGIAVGIKVSELRWRR